MKIKFKIYLLISLALLTLVIVSGLGLYSTAASNTVLHKMSDELIPEVSTVLMLRLEANDMVRRLYESSSKAALSHDEQVVELKRIVESKREEDAATLKLFNEYNASRKHPDVAAIWNQVANAWTTWYPEVATDFTRVMEVAANNPTPENLRAFFQEANDTVPRFRETTTAIIENIEKIANLILRQNQELVDAAENSAGTIRNIQIIISLLSVAGLILLGFLTLKTVVGPIEQTRNTVMNVERENNLQLRVNYESSDEVGELVKAFNAMMARLQTSLCAIHDRVNAATGAVMTLTSSAEQVASSSSSQSSSTSAMAASVEEMTVSINNVTGSANEAQSMAQHAGKISDEGGQIIESTANEMIKIGNTVAQASSVIKNLGEESQQISSVVQVIKEVADQTNLL
ncbi:MAG: methyl-accepting chemotaxis protein, partial [Azoarcus sp.]|nr:methyl-accepting chemotaxis protein [Azoarcus sp.]